MEKIYRFYKGFFFFFSNSYIVLFRAELNALSNLNQIVSAIWLICSSKGHYRYIVSSFIFLPFDLKGKPICWYNTVCIVNRKIYRKAVNSCGKLTLLLTLFFSSNGDCNLIAFIQNKFAYFTSKFYLNILNGAFILIRIKQNLDFAIKKWIIFTSLWCRVNSLFCLLLKLHSNLSKFSTQFWLIL